MAADSKADLNPATVNETPSRKSTRMSAIGLISHENRRLSQHSLHNLRGELRIQLPS
jgi:hypothetical protein